MNTGKFKVDFICIGAMKSGTTFLYNLLDASNQFDLSSLKEPCFYSGNYHLGYGWYKNLWKNNGKLKAEFSAHYFYKPDSLKKIKIEQPNCKLVLILRNPYSRAVSHLKHFYRIGKITNINDVKEIRTRVVERSLYFKYLKELFDVFEKKDIKILYFDHLKSNIEQLVYELTSFLKIDDLDIADVNPEKGEGYIPKYVVLEKLKNSAYCFLFKFKLHGLIKLLTGSKIIKIYKSINSNDSVDDSEFNNAISKFKDIIYDDLIKLQNSNMGLDRKIIDKWLCSIEK